MIDVDLDVFKALTALLEQEGQTHNDILRSLLLLDSPLEPENRGGLYSLAAEALQRAAFRGQFYSRGLALPNGTQLRARYKGAEYHGQIKSERFFTEDNQQHESPSAAASHITSTVVNGLRFWEAKRPHDIGWRRLDVIRDGLKS